MFFFFFSSLFPPLRLCSDRRVRGNPCPASGLLVLSALLLFAVVALFGYLSGRRSHLRQSLLPHPAGGDRGLAFHPHQPASCRAAQLQLHAQPRPEQHSHAQRKLHRLQQQHTRQQLVG